MCPKSVWIGVCANAAWQPQHAVFLSEVSATTDSHSILSHPWNLMEKCLRGMESRPRDAEEPLLVLLISLIQLNVITRRYLTVGTDRTVGL